MSHEILGEALTDKMYVITELLIHRGLSLRRVYSNPLAFAVKQRNVDLVKLVLRCDQDYDPNSMAQQRDWRIIQLSRETNWRSPDCC